MNKDYAKRRVRRPARKKKAIVRTVLIIGLAILIPFGLFYIKHFRMINNGGHATKLEPKKPQKTVKQVADNSDLMQFDFYTLLPKMNVQTGAEGADTKISKSVSEKNDNSVHQDTYVLQVAAYHDVADAQKLMSALSAVSSNLYMQKINMNDELWYRVLIGPFNSYAKVQSVQNKLKVQRLPYILIKIPTSGAHRED